MAKYASVLFKSLFATLSHQRTNRVFGNNFTQKIKTHRVPLCFQDKWSSEKSRCLKTCWCFKLWLTDVFILTFSCFDKYLCFHIFSREVHVTVKDVNEYIPEWGQVSTQLWWSWWGWWWWSRWWWCDVMFAKRRSMPVKLRRERCLRRLSRWTPLIGDHHKNYLIIIIIINIITLFIILIIIIVILFDTETVPQLSAMSAPTAYQALTSHLLLIRFGITITISFISHIINNVIITTK